VAGSAAAVVVVLLAIRLFSSSSTAPEGYVALNVIPWAEVTRISSHGGGDITLDQKLVTPCRLALPEGTYDLRLSNPAFTDQLVVTVTVRKGEALEIRKIMPGFDLHKATAAF